LHRSQVPSTMVPVVLNHAERTRMSCGGWRMLQATEEKVEKGRQGTGGLGTWMLATLKHISCQHSNYF
jgi:hypothetical protein